MKKIINLMFLIIIIAATSSCCNEKNKAIDSRFAVLEQGSCYAILYDKETKVMYAVSRGGYNSGNFTLLVNADGTPMIYKGEDFNGNINFKPQTAGD